MSDAEGSGVDSTGSTRSLNVEGGRTTERAVVTWVLATLGVAFAWFAYIDAPITDGAMFVITMASVAGLLAVIAALISCEVQALVSARRMRRVAASLFVLELVLMLAAITATLNLRGSEQDDTGTQTALVS